MPSELTTNRSSVAAAAAAGATLFAQLSLRAANSDEVGVAVSVAVATCTSNSKAAILRSIASHVLGGANSCDSGTNGHGGGGFCDAVRKAAKVVDECEEEAEGVDSDGATVWGHRHGKLRAHA